MQYIFGIWVIFVAVVVSMVAAYYSIIGLTAIFAGAIIPVIIMGTVLEVGKVTATVLLHGFWNKLDFFIKLYLIPAVLILMFITSMGVFGFLSHAHIEQGINSIDISSRIDRIDLDISRQEGIIKRANTAVEEIDSQTSTTDVSVQNRIDTQQSIIDDIRKRLEIDISVQQTIINDAKNEVRLLEDSLNVIENQIDTLNKLQQSGDIRGLQLFVGARIDGVAGIETNQHVEKMYVSFNKEKEDLQDEINKTQNTNNKIIKDSQSKINELQKEAQEEIKKATDAIDAFRSQLVTISSHDYTSEIEQRDKIVNDANKKIDELYDKRFELESQKRSLEVEVGPVRYIAKLIYDDTNEDLLERAVRWVTLILVAVFDPLAIVLLISGLSIMRRNLDNIVIDDQNSNSMSIESDDNVRNDTSFDGIDICNEQINMITNNDQIKNNDIDEDKINETEILFEETIISNEMNENDTTENEKDESFDDNEDVGKDDMIKTHKKINKIPIVTSVKES